MTHTYLNSNVLFIALLSQNWTIRVSFEKCRIKGNAWREIVKDWGWKAKKWPKLDWAYSERFMYLKSSATL